MKHQKEICSQRLRNMREGINSSLIYLTNLQENLGSQLNKTADDYESIKENLVIEIEEIRDFLDWVKEQ